MHELDKMMQAMQSALDLQKKAQQELKEKRVEGVAGGGMVRVVIDGNLEVRKVVLEAALLQQQDAQLLSDMVCCAVNDAIQQAHEMGASAVNKHLMSSDLLSKLIDK
ncbi:MAG: YbaB/EbfC family nucleoid-associated protein [Myxococcota bacterium]